MIEVIVTPGMWSIMIVIAAVIDYLVGDPSFLIHPVVLIGRLIKGLTSLLNRGKSRRAKGLLMELTVLAAVVLVILVIEYLTYSISPYLCIVIDTWLLSSALAEKSLFLAGKKCKKALLDNDLEALRRSTGEIVGRDTTKLNKHDLLRAVIETEAENGIDGVIAPLFYMYLGVILTFFVPFLNPLVLAYLYKAINTMDSMVGYIYEPYTDFGYYPAKTDDAANFLPARIGSYLLLFAGSLQGYKYRQALSIYRRDKSNHASPNAGHPEAAVAGILGIQLGGSNIYFGHIMQKPVIGQAEYNLELWDIESAMSLVLLSEVLMLAFGSLLVALIYTLMFFW